MDGTCIMYVAMWCIGRMTLEIYGIITVLVRLELNEELQVRVVWIRLILSDGAECCGTGH